jgi:hypothetical protein
MTFLSTVVWRPPNSIGSELLLAVVEPLTCNMLMSEATSELFTTSTPRIDVCTITIARKMIVSTICAANRASHSHWITICVTVA